MPVTRGLGNLVSRSFRLAHVTGVSVNGTLDPLITIVGSLQRAPCNPTKLERSYTIIESPELSIRKLPRVAWHIQMVDDN